MELADAVDAYVQRSLQLADHVRGRELATRQSLIGPLFSLLGWDLTDPRECLPEYRADGLAVDVPPLDWVFLLAGEPVLLVEARATGERLPLADETLAAVFSACPTARVGIITNGLQWQFYTDLDRARVLDGHPFLVWDLVIGPKPLDLLNLLQPGSLDPQHLRAFALNRRREEALANAIDQLLAPSAEFIKLLVRDIEPRSLTMSVVESWRPLVERAMRSWVLRRATHADVAFDEPIDAAFSLPATDGDMPATARTPNQHELDGFANVQSTLGPSRPVEYEDMAGYFKIHLPGFPRAVVCRLYFGHRRFRVSLPCSKETASSYGLDEVRERGQGWCQTNIDSSLDLANLEPLLIKIYDDLAREVAHSQSQ